MILLLPLVAAYEASTRGLLGGIRTGPAEQLVAFSILRRAFDLAGATGSLLPALTLVACLLGWHIARKDRWAIRPMFLAGMTLEGALLSLPIVGAAVLLSRGIPCAAVQGGEVERMATLAVGAAVYEELLFRLIGFVLLHLLFVDVIGLSRKTGDVLTLIASAALFAAYHYLGQEQFGWPSFVFRSVAGLFLGSVFLTRGFGVTAVCHAAYDMIWVTVFCRMSTV